LLEFRSIAFWGELLAARATPFRMSGATGKIHRILHKLMLPWRGPGPSLMAANPAYRDFHIGRWTYGWPEVHRWRPTQQLSVGSFCSIAADVKILLGGEHRLDSVSTYPFGQFFRVGDANAHEFSRGDVIIGNDVWIGHGALILSGTRIGDGAAIGAYSLVSGEVPPYAIAAGNPAKVLRFRFPSAIVDELLRICWWEWDDETIRRHAPELMSSDIASFVDRFGRR
jgi:chloramphenicol O-acetyltransferase type B